MQNNNRLSVIAFTCSMTLTMIVFIIFTGETGRIGSAAPGMAAMLFPAPLFAAIFSYVHIRHPQALMAGSLALAMLATADMGLVSLVMAASAWALNSMGLRMRLLEIDPAQTRTVIYWSLAGRILGGCLASIATGTDIGHYATLAMCVAAMGLTIGGINVRTTQTAPPQGLSFGVALEPPMLYLMLFTSLAAALEGALASQLTSAKLVALFPLYHAAGDALSLFSLKIAPQAKPKWPMLVAAYAGLFIGALSLPPLPSILAYGLSCLAGTYLALEFSQWLRVRSEGRISVTTSVSFAQSILSAIIGVISSSLW
ncbi:MAG: hypothetical protein HQK86_12750 [Nitrospinae bacterium]|nr:hypothetical protein [Nitrospinota bacterium]MBF0634855.1 hypothetical protein [Nitrospinota bacterium]